jgi:serine/threonine protein kinase/Tol biopolymer transport system component
VTAPLVGRSVAHYRVTAAIGSGGMGEVYRATDTKLGRDVALKVLPSEVRQDPARLARFRREARLLASLNHPNVAAIHGLEEADGMPILVLELVEGEDLAARLARGRMPLDEALGIAGQIVDALADAHQKGIVHRDLKPANVKITPEGTVKVLDFGLAKAYAEDAASDSGADPSRSPTLSHAGTLAGVILGTAAYMSPEQAKGGAVDKRADIWAFGCVLYEMLAGRRPFVGASVSDTLAEILKGEPEWTELPGNTAPAIRRLLRRCLVKDRRKRLADIADARLELEHAQAGSAADSDETRPLSPLRERLAWTAALALLAGTALMLALHERPAASAREMRVEITTPPTQDPASLAISSNGMEIAFVVATAGRPGLWLRSLESGSARPLAGTDGATFPFWSPDGRSLGFFTDDGKLKRIDLDGGTLRVLANAPLARGGAWSRDDTILFAPFSGPIFRISAAGGEPKAVTRLEPSQSSHVFPWFLPDGDHFVYCATGSPDARGVYLTSLGAGVGRRLLDADAPALFAPQGYLLFVRGGTLFAQRLDPARLELAGQPFPVADSIAMGQVAASQVAAASVAASGQIVYRTGGEAERHQFRWFERSGKELAKAGEPDPAYPRSPSLSPDGRRLAMHRVVAGNTDIWTLELGRGALSRFTSNAAIEIWPIWSPDGSRILFSSNRDGSFALYEKATDGAADEKLVLSMRAHPEDWSRDGRLLLLQARDLKSGSDLWVLPIGEGGEPHPVLRTEFDEWGGQFSPDARWMAYASTESGRSEVYLQPFPGPGAKLPISVGGGAQVRWRSDGRELFFIALDNRLMAVPISLSADGGSASVGAPVPLFLTHVGGAVQGASRQQYFVSQDGRRFLMNSVMEGAPFSPLTLILNWKPRPAGSSE